MKTQTVRVAETDSTNKLISRFDVDDDTLMVVVADSQTAGRGCGSNKWESEPGKNLTFSLKYVPRRLEANRQFLISMQISVALYRAMLDFGIQTTIKWPNDIYWNDRKLAGILIESRLQGSRIRNSVIGIGLNVNQQRFLSDAPNPVSMRQILGKETEIDDVLQHVISRFIEIEDDVAELYKTLLFRREGYFKYHDANGFFEAKIVDVDYDGTLSLLDKDGKLRKYAFKEVSFCI